MAEQTEAQHNAIKRIMKLCFHQDDVDETIDTLVVVGVKPDLITQAMSSATDGQPRIGVLYRRAPVPLHEFHIFDSRVMALTKFGWPTACITPIVQS